MAEEAYILPASKGFLVVVPRDGLLFRTNAGGAAKLRESLLSGQGRERSAPVARTFPPSEITIVPCTACNLSCRYCPNTREHWGAGMLDLRFCRVACDVVAAKAAASGRPWRAAFHGTGEPTFHWDHFMRCVEIVERASKAHGAEAGMFICTAGQLDEAQATFLAEHFREIQVSIDGRPKLQNRHRPRRDGKDSYEPAVRTARIAAAAGRVPKINVTVTCDTVREMSAMVDLVAEEIGDGIVNFDAMCPVSGMECESMAPPDPESFVRGFREAVERGNEMNIAVAHASIGIGALMQPKEPEVPMSIVPGGGVIAFYDFSGVEGDRCLDGSYGRFDEDTGQIIFDRERLARAQELDVPAPCMRCICNRICNGKGSIRGRMIDFRNGSQICRTYIGVLATLLERAADGIA